MNPHSQQVFSDIPFRVRVGVVGARNLVNTETLTNKLREIFSQEIPKLYNEESRKRINKAKRTSLAFSVLTTLAGDAERLVANEVLTQRQGTIEVVLPCPRTAFVREFVSAEAQREFEDLFKKARRPIALKKRLVSLKMPTVERKEHLREILIEAERYIVDGSDILLVVRAGKSHDDNIANIVEYAEDKQRPVIYISALTPYEITNERRQGLNASAIKGLDAFNVFSINSEEQASYIENVYQDLFASLADIEEKSKKHVRECLLPFYVRASKLAKKNQKIYQRAGLLVYSFSATTVAAVALGTLVHKLSLWAFGFEFLLLLMILITVLWADRMRSHRKWIENRFLAERLRAAQFLAACETEVTPIRVLPYLTGKGQFDDWTLIAFNEIWQRLPAMKGGSDVDVEKRKEFIREHWLEDQLKFHKKKTQKAHRLNNRLERLGIVVFGFALLAAALHLIFFNINSEWMELPLTFAAIVLPAVGAAIGGIRTHREYSRLAKRSENMAQNLTELKESLRKAAKPEEFETLLREIEEMMLIETWDWLMLMRFAKLETAA